MSVTAHGLLTIDALIDTSTGSGGVLTVGGHTVLNVAPVLGAGNITLTGLNQSPVNTVPAGQTTSEDTALVFSGVNAISVSDLDAGANPGQVTISVVHGTLTLSGTAGLSFSSGDGVADGAMTFVAALSDLNAALAGLSYQPVANYNGGDTLTIVTNDQGNTGIGGALSDTDTVTITVTAVNDPPVTSDDSYTTAEDTQLTIAASGLLTNDSDVEGDSLTVVLLSGPSHGTLGLNANGSFSYTPAANFNGSDSFTYRTNDGTADSNIATVALTITAVNDAPVAADNSYTTNEDIQLTITAPGLLTNDSDVDGDPLTAVLVSGPSHGTLTLNANGSFSYTPAANFNGSDSFTYRANDGLLDSNEATVTLAVATVNDAPLTADDDYSTSEDTVLTVAAPGVLANDSDVEGDPLSAALVSGPSHGTLTLNANGSFSYTPGANFNGTDSFTYQVNDGAADSNVATASLTVTAVNDAPVASDDSYTAAEDSQLTIAAPGLLANDNDLDGDALTAVLVSGPSHGTLTLNANGSFCYTSAPNFNGSDSFTYRVNDGLLDSNEAAVTFDVAAVNDPPIAVDDGYSTNEDTPLTVAATGVLGNDSDVEGDCRPPCW